MTQSINLDAGFYATPLKASDDRLMPLYEVVNLSIFRLS